MPATKAAGYMKAKAISAPAAPGRSPSGRNKTDRRLPTSSSRSMPQEVCNRDLPNHRVVRTQSLLGFHRSAAPYAGWNLAHGPDSSQRKEQHSCENQEAIVCAPLDDSGDHGYIPPVALSVSCLLAIVCPFCCAPTVTCQVPPEPRSPLPSYMPPPLSLALMTVFIEAIPIAGIAAMKKVTVTFAPVIGFPSWPVSFTRTTLLPLCGGSGSVVNSTFACCSAGAFMEAA